MGDVIDMEKPQMTRHKRASSRIVAAERRTKAMQLRRAGATYEQIADALDISVSSARNYIRDALESLNTELRETAVEVKRLEEERLDEMLRILWPKVREGNFKAMDRVIRIQERRAKLAGLDSPTKHTLEGQVEHQVEIPREQVEHLERLWKDSVMGEAEEIHEAELVESVDDEPADPG